MMGIKTLCLRCARAALLGVALGLTTPATIMPALAQQKNPDRNAYFGESTSTPVGRWMPGSWATASPVPTTLSSMRRAKPSSTHWATTSRSTRRMDFMGVTDHSEYVGVTK